jgi:hypothetical protein
MQRGRTDSVTVEVLYPSPSGQLAGFQPGLRVAALTVPELKEAFLRLEESERKRLAGFVAVRDAIQRRDALAAQKALESMDYQAVPELRILREFWKSRPADPLAQKFAALEKSMHSVSLDEVAERLARVITDELHGKTALVCRWNGTKFLPALLCENFTSAVYALALVKFATGNLGLALCAKCGKIFPQDRSDQDYCSLRCREAHRVARWRLRKRAEAKRGRRGKIQKPKVKARRERQ